MFMLVYYMCPFENITMCVYWWGGGGGGGERSFFIHFMILHIPIILFSTQEIRQQQVFAFLPLRSYGFRFIVQGDFDLPSSRECVTSDSSWNQWLREQVPSLFLQAMHEMRVGVSCCYYCYTFWLCKLVSSLTMCQIVYL